MAILSVAQARSYATRAGFTGAGLNTIVAIAQAESSLDTNAKHINPDGSLDRGILQINSRWHPEVSDLQAYDAAAAFAAGYRISSHGTDFHAWATYTNGAYKRYLTSGGSGVGSIGGSTGGKSWYNYPQTHGYITSYLGAGTDTPHYAIDFGTPMGTPFFFPESGTVKVADYATWDGAAGGGEVFMQPDKGGPQEYGFHLDQVLVKPGQHVKAGDLVGYTGGQNYGGHHPTSTTWSTGPHLHFGLLSKYINTPAGTRPYGPDPSGMINDAIAHGIGNGSADNMPLVDTTPGTTTDQQHAEQVLHEPISDRVHELITNFPGFAGMALALDEAETFPGLIWYNTEGFDPAGWTANGIRSVLDTVLSNMFPFAVRSMFGIIGIILVAGLVYKLVQKSGIPQDIKPLLEMGAAA